MFNATRLTCFALISSIESDSRTAVADLQVLHGVPLPSATSEKAQARLNQDRGSTSRDSKALIDYLDFADAHEFLLANKGLLPPEFRSALLGVASQLGSFTQTRNRVAHTRPLEITDLPLTIDLAKRLVAEAPSFWHATQEMLAQIESDPASILGLHINLPSDPINEPFHNLPAPDFDETGFLGRNADVRKIKRYLLGSWPAISILGDGGIGKTAIALKVAYDLLDDPKADFDAIVWVSAKNQQLTVTEIERINGAIQNSLGMFSEAALQLGAHESDDPTEDLLEYMSTFKVLLVLDNMETATDERLREFLREIPNGSKVLMTSRIGVFKENDVKLGSLSLEESRSLLLSLAHGRNVKVLKELDEPGRIKLVEQLKGHPLYIKWVVSGVQAGKRPSDMVGSSRLLLDFCMSNVYEQLTPGARKILQSMQVLRGVRYQGELAFVNEVPAVKIQQSLLDLMRSNFVSMTYVSGLDSDAGYEVGDFAREYLSKQHPPKESLRKHFLAMSRDLKKLSSTLQRGSSDGVHRYNPSIVEVRDIHNAPAAKHLVRAMRETRSGDFEKALASCREALQLSPGYYECRRVEAYVHAYRGDHAAAREAYEQAIELVDEDSRALVLFHYASYLEEEGIEHSLARTYLEEVARLDPENCDVFLSIGSSHFAEGSYLMAIGSATAALKKNPSPAQTRALDLLLVRAATFGGETAFAEEHLADALELVESCLEPIVESHSSLRLKEFDDWFCHLASLCDRITVSASSEQYLVRKAQQLAIDCRLQYVHATVANERTTGVIARMPPGRQFGFVENASGSHFFHVNDLQDRRAWATLEPGNLLAFISSPQGDGTRLKATSVKALF